MNNALLDVDLPGEVDDSGSDSKYDAANAVDIVPELEEDSADSKPSGGGHMPEGGQPAEARDFALLEASLQQLLQELAKGKEVLGSARQSRRRRVETPAATIWSQRQGRQDLPETVEALKDQLKTSLQAAEAVIDKARQEFWFSLLAFEEDRLTQDGKPGSLNSAGDPAKRAKEAAQSKATKLKEGVDILCMEQPAA
eukprot:2644672-Pleurochrysis_carterae.AAC.2